MYPKSLLILFLSDGYSDNTKLPASVDQNSIKDIVEDTEKYILKFIIDDMKTYKSLFFSTFEYADFPNPLLKKEYPPEFKPNILYDIISNKINSLSYSKLNENRMILNVSLNIISELFDIVGKALCPYDEFSK